LPSVRVTGKAQVDTQLHDSVKGVRIMAQEDVNRVRRHKFFHPLQIPSHEVLRPRCSAHPCSRLKIDADQIEGCCRRGMVILIVRGYRDALPAQDPDSLGGEKLSYGIFSLAPSLVVAEASVY